MEVAQVYIPERRTLIQVLPPANAYTSLPPAHAYSSNLFFSTDAYMQLDLYAYVMVYALAV